MKVTKKSYTGLLVKSLLLGTLAIVVSINPLVLNEAVADPLDKSSPKIAHGMYRDRGKSSPKIAHGIRTIMEENIAGRTNRDNLKEAIFMSLELGEFEMAEELLYELNRIERVSR